VSYKYQIYRSVHNIIPNGTRTCESPRPSPQKPQRYSSAHSEQVKDYTKDINHMRREYQR
jgi:hypothetical protein